ncbi:MAG: hypothetical protein U0174_09845 [Polyangiaceae bacterium]
MKPNLVLAVLLSIATSSFAATASAAPGGHEAKAPAAPAAKGGRHGKYPIPAAEFRNASNERLQKAREKMEEHLKTKKVPAEKAQLVRARFDEVATKVNAAVAKATADGSVTKEEVREVHQAAVKARKDGRAAARAQKKAEKAEGKEPKKAAPKAAPGKDAPKEAPKAAKKDDTQEAP